MSDTPRLCNMEMGFGKVCGRQVYDDRYCIFHSVKEEKSLQLFQKKLDEILNDDSVHSYDFVSFTFPEGVTFPEEFSKPVDFDRAVFQGCAEFIEAAFKREAYFSGVTFKGLADFTAADFGERADFQGADFLENAYFMDTTFKGEADFRGVEARGGAHFSRAIFADSLLLAGRDREGHAFYEEVHFDSVKLLKPGKVEFRKIDLSRFRFLETDVRKVHFVDVKWNKSIPDTYARKTDFMGVRYKHRKIKGRNVVFDEVSPVLDLLDPTKMTLDFALIAQLYRRLRANYQENLQYSEAGDFYIGEMEMTRKAEKNIFKKLPLLFYKAISNYGESYYRPLCWIAAILVIFPLLFMFAGVQPIDLHPSNPAEDVINYRLDFSPIESFAPTWEKIGDYRTSGLYTLSIFFLVRDKKYTTMTSWGRFLFVVESILSPVTLAFFLLALRRRFKR